MRLGFEEGDLVRITSGPFADFNGTINEINPDQAKLKVLVNMAIRPLRRVATALSTGSKFLELVDAIWATMGPGSSTLNSPSAQFEQAPAALLVLACGG